MNNKNGNQDVPIKVFAFSKQQKTYDRRDEQQIAKVIRQEVLSKSKVAYLSVKVKVKRASDNSPKSLIAYMLRKETYTADVVKVDVDKKYNVQAVHEDYDESKDIDDEAEEESEEETDGAQYGLVDFVAGTPVPQIPTALAAVNAVAQMAANAGLTTKVLLGTDASMANYKQYLKSGLLGFVNVGHGNTWCIVLDDGTLPSTWFQGLTNKQLSPAVVYFNSCQVHNPPLEPAVMSAGARTFIGGNVNLLIGPSENVCKCFWNKILLPQVAMGDALHTCEAQNYPTPNAHDISGDLGIFPAGHIVVFQHADFRGHHRHIFGWEKNLNHPSDFTLNDQISSFVVVSGTWKFYRDANFEVSLGGEFGPGAYRWVQAVGVNNDQISSLRIVKG
ncbi:MAG: beta/gamma crystallin family protein [Sedimentisphaerales bacterium]|nr:beta/gamma crystallin family protein [Sedimentisphaerales bacterium]